MECDPKNKTHRFPMAQRTCYCGSLKVPKAKEDDVGENTFLFRASTIVRRNAEAQAARLAEEEARLIADDLPFDADLPELAATTRHVPGAVKFDTAAFLERYHLEKEHLSPKDRAMLRGLGLRGAELEAAADE